MSRMSTKQIKQIKIIHGIARSNDEQDRFKNEVNKAIHNGWSIDGELTVTSCGPNIYFTQRMVKYQEEDNSDD